MMKGSTGNSKQYDSDSNSNGWKKNYTEAEQMYIACRLGQADDNNMSIDLTKITPQLKKEARQAYKRLKRN